MLNIRRKVVLPILLLVAAAMGAVLAACGGDDSSTNDSGASSTATVGSGAGTIEITHALGTTAVPAGVERVVALGPADLDAALALGAPLVGATSSGGERDLLPWAATAPGADAIEILPVQGDALTVDLEQVAALHPDLILAATYFDVDEVYGALSEIAPTIAYQHGPVTDTWEEVTRQTGAALGQAARADEIIASVQEQVVAAAAEHRQLEGATFTFAYAYSGGMSVLRDPTDVMFTVPGGLGMSLSPPILAFPPGDSFAIDLSLEELEALDADVLAIFDAGDEEVRSTLESNPLYATVGAVTRGAVVDLDYDEFVGLRQPSARSIPWVLDRIVPRLADAAAR